jgi:pyruvate,water dikinase
MVISTQVRSIQTSKDQALILWFDEIGIEDIPVVGGKNASLGEMIQQLTPKGVNVPTGFAITAYAYRYFIEKAGLEAKLRKLFADLDVDDVSNLQQHGQKSPEINPKYELSPRTGSGNWCGLSATVRALWGRYRSRGSLFCHR